MERLIITLDPQTGAVNVEGPIDNRLLAFGMLELAKEAISAHGAMLRDRARRVDVVQPAALVNLRA